MKCALYRCWSQEGALLYVGISPSPLNRIHDHARHKDWAQDIANVTLEWFANRSEAAAAERLAIQAEAPSANLHHTGTPPRTEPTPCLGKNCRASAELSEFLLRRKKRDFAREIGVSAPMLSQYLAGIRKPRLERMIAIEKATAGAVTVHMWGQAA